MHTETHKLAGKTVLITEGEHAGLEYRIEDWWDKLTGGPWGLADGNPAALIYAMRIGLQKFRVPADNEVLYGKIGMFGHLVHVDEIGEVVNEKTN